MIPYFFVVTQDRCCLKLLVCGRGPFHVLMWPPLFTCRFFWPVTGQNQVPQLDTRGMLWHSAWQFFRWITPQLNLGHAVHVGCIHKAFAHSWQFWSQQCWSGTWGTWHHIGCVQHGVYRPSNFASFYGSWCRNISLKGRSWRWLQCVQQTATSRTFALVCLTCCERKITPTHRISVLDMP